MAYVFNPISGQLDIVGSSSSGANTALSNLSAVAINIDLLPTTTAANLTLGSASKLWDILFLDRYIHNGTLSVMDTSTQQLLNGLGVPKITWSGATDISLNSLTSNGFVKTSGGTGLLTIDTNTYLNTTLKGTANGVAELDVNSLVPVTQLPPAALERLVIVADQTARFALTTATVQNGDTVKQTDTGVMYFVKDDTNLGNSAGYAEYTAGTASAVAWSGITGIPAPVSSLSGTNTGDQTFAGLSPMTTNGDLITRVAGVPARLGIGSDYQVLTLVSGLPAWTGGSFRVVTDNLYAYTAPNVGLVGGTNTVMGINAGTAITSGSENILIGGTTGQVLVTGSSNTAVGYAALRNITGGNNVGIGRAALINLTSGAENTAIGKNTGATQTIESANTLIGYLADITATNAGSIALGASAKTTASNQFMIGSAATPISQTVYGSGSTTTKTADVASGNTGNLTVQSGDAASGNSGDLILKVGTASATYGKIKLQPQTASTIGQVWTATDTSGSGNWSTLSSGITGSGTATYIPTFTGASAIGDSTLTIDTSTLTATSTSLAFNIKTIDEAVFGASKVIAIATGDASGATTSSGALSVKSGIISTNSGTSGNVVVSSGNATGTTSTSGALTLSTGTATGTRGKIKLVDGSEGVTGNVWTSTDTAGNGHWASPALGFTSYAAGTYYGISTGTPSSTYSLMIGVSTGAALSSGSTNTGIGNLSSVSLSTGNNNTALGYNTLNALVSSDSNTAIGSYSLALVTGTDNTALGREAGYAVTTGANNVFLGSAAGTTLSSVFSSIALGAQSKTTASNQMMIGATSYEINETIYASGNSTIKTINGTSGTTGNKTVTTGDVTTGTSGAITLASGLASSAAGVSGAVNLKSGTSTTGVSGIVTVASGATTTATSGVVNINTGAPTGGISGALNVITGAAVSTFASGALNLKTGTTATGTSGAIVLSTGIASGTAASSGNMTVSTGNASAGGAASGGVTGDMTINTGNSSHTGAGTTGTLTISTGTNDGTQSGNLSLETGSASTTPGSILFKHGGTLKATINSTTLLLGQNVSLTLTEGNGGGDTIIVKAPTSVTTAWTMTLPPAAPAADGSFLTATTGGVASWQAPTTPTVQIKVAGDTTYTRTSASVKYIKVTCVGGGAGAGVSSANPGGGSGGGGGGGAAIKWITNPASSYSISVGASAGSDTNGNSTTFDTTTVVATGGTKGVSPGITGVGGQGGAGGIGTAGDILLGGCAGGTGSTSLTGVAYGAGGNGGAAASAYGGGGGEGSSSGVGAVGRQYGGGGGGSCGGSAAGGAGAAGVIIIEEFYI